MHMLESGKRGRAEPMYARPAALPCVVDAARPGAGDSYLGCRRHRR